MKELMMQAQSMQAELVEWRRTLHQNPEVGLEIPKTSAFVREKLIEMGYDPQPVGGDGMVALAGGKNPGKCFLIRADMDALPIKEESGVPFQSVNGSMHACGHDMHTTMLLGAAKLLKGVEDQIQGTVKLMFQPGEEGCHGAKIMVENGVLEQPQVDAAAMIHVMTGMPIPAGVIGVPGAGSFTAASDRFEITIKGKGGHGAMPEKTVDPLNVMSHIHIALQAILSRELSCDDSAVITVGMMHGGTAVNVVPDTAEMKGTIRTYEPRVRDFVCGRVKSIAKSVAETFGAEAEVAIILGYPSVMVDGNVSATVRETLAGVFGKAVIDPKSVGFVRMSGAEDFAYVAEKVPSVLLAISAGGDDPAYQYPVHHPKACFNEKVLFQGAAAYALAALGWLAKNQ